MSRPTAAVFSGIHAGFRNGKLPLGFAVFAAIGVAVGPGYLDEVRDERRIVVEQQADCRPIVWQDAWTGTEREHAWHTLIDQGYELREGRHADLIVPPGCEAVHPTDTEKD